MAQQFRADGVLQFPYRGAPQTVSVMRDAVMESQKHFEVRQLAEQICEQVESKDYVSECLAIYFYLLGHYRYMRDPRTVELVKAPYLVAQQLLGGGRPGLDCDDAGALFCSLCMMIGAKCYFVTVAFKDAFYNGERQFSHVFCQVQEPRTQKPIVFDLVAAEKTPAMLSRVVASKIWGIP